VRDEEGREEDADGNAAEVDSDGVPFSPPKHYQPLDQVDSSSIFVNQFSRS
jgi:hypothetical protein